MAHGTPFAEPGETMKKITTILSVVLLAGCATTEFKHFEARDSIREGAGGTKTVVDGVELWSNGDPPRRYKILGIIEDERGGGGFSSHMRQSAIVEKAKEVGADALIEGDVQSQVTGFVSNSYATGYAFGRTANAYGSGFSVPMQRMFSKYTAIKYLDQTYQPATPPASQKKGCDLAKNASGELALACPE